MSAVRVENLVKSFEASRGHAPRDVVNKVSFEVADGEFVVLVGPSGCGKSTILRMIAGLESVTSGSVLLGGRLVNDIAPKDRDVAMVFQNYALYPHMDVAQNMSFGLRLRGMPRDEIQRRVDRAAAVLGLDQPENLLGRRPKALSGGQRQRVALGRAMVREPAVFLFDEPLSNLDAKMRVEMRAEIMRLHAELGATMIYVTHDQIEAMTMADRIVVLCNGEVQQTAAPLEIYHRPANMFVAGFIGSPAMNFIRGHFILEGGDMVFVENADSSSPHVMRLHWAGGTPRPPVELFRQVVLGLRPEHFHEAAPDGDASISFSAELKSVENTGPEASLHLRTAGHELTVRVRRPPGAGTDALRLVADPAQVSLFDPASGRRLS